ncbi:hypothetical protein BgAZ_200500 [Babesia gibsoni]|uniref:Uncharacterized protein n=1 Tax=Babesia gibsoni TaxID=33632 RepID=A0AAD8LJ44_BABGI|nr:hypothetical protein BgAZ_200500 [Babesia gibsoni]
MTSSSELIAWLLYSLALTLVSGPVWLVVKAALLLVTLLNILIGLFFVSYLRLRVNLHGVLCWDGNRIMLTHSRGSLAALLGMQLVNAYGGLDGALGIVAKLIYSPQKASSRPLMASILQNSCIMPFHRLGCQMPFISRANSFSDAFPGNAIDLRIRKSKSVTFNENVEVHLISSTYLQNQRSKYFGRRGSLEPNVSAIPTTSFAEPFLQS